MFTIDPLHNLHLGTATQVVTPTIHLHVSELEIPMELSKNTVSY